MAGLRETAKTFEAQASDADDSKASMQIGKYNFLLGTENASRCTRKDLLRKTFFQLVGKCAFADDSFRNLQRPKRQRSHTIKSA